MVGPSISGMTTSLTSRSTVSPRAEDLQRFLAIAGGQHLVTVAGKRPLCDGPDHRLVLDQQDRAGPPHSFSCGLPRVSGWPWPPTSWAGR